MLVQDPDDASRTMTYADSPIHRIIPGFMMQGGDITAGNGTGKAMLPTPQKKRQSTVYTLAELLPGTQEALHIELGLYALSMSHQHLNHLQNLF